jgi:hypothetical protein
MRIFTDDDDLDAWLWFSLIAALAIALLILFAMP